MNVEAVMDESYQGRAKPRVGDATTSAPPPAKSEGGGESGGKSIWRPKSLQRG